MHGKLFFVNACIRRDRSRTLRLTRALIDRYPGYDVDEVVLEDIGLKPLDSGFLDRRDGLIGRGDYSDPIFDLAKRFADADVIVVATPYWENCFDSHLKIFMEHAAVLGILFRYESDGSITGLCRARALYYVTTSGGPIPDDADLGYSVYRSLCEIYGIKECRIVSASALDIVTNDPGKIMEDAISRVGKMDIL
jgi:FMN-dependent NADH-azoreductase